MLPSSGASCPLPRLKSMMAAAPHPVFRQRFCKAESCGVRFFICSHCDRGQQYCSNECRRRSRREQLRAANHRHQQSPEGRDDHRDRQRAYRRRKAAISHASCPKVPPRHQPQSPTEPLDHLHCQSSDPDHQVPVQISVTYQSTSRGVTSAMLLLPRSKWPIEPVRESARGFRVIVCHFCGRIGLFLNPYAEPG
jgi:hypothetical protein